MTKETAMTNKNNNDQGLEAMLYVLFDESIDRNAFEAKLENDPALAEAVAESVSIVQGLKQAAMSSNASMATKPRFEDSVVRSRQMPFFVKGLVAMVSIAAAFCVIFFRWQRDTVIASAESLPEIAAAWIDLNEANTDLMDGSIFRFESDGESDTESAGLGAEYKQLAIADDMPDWMLLAVTGTDSQNPEAIK